MAREFFETCRSLLNIYTSLVDNDSLFLPDFCEVRIVFAVVLIGELLAFLLILTPLSASGERWNDLGMISLFIQWVALTSIGVLCFSRRWLRLLDNLAAATVSYAMVLVVTLLLSEVAYLLLEQRLIDVKLYAAMQVSEEAYWFAQQQLNEPGVSSALHREFLFRNLGISAIVAALALRYFYVQFQWRANLESEAQSRIQALQSRIRPHFLFNSMNTIASFTRSKPELAEQVVEDLADLFRVSLGDARIPVSLSRELEVCREYLRIEELRLGERLQMQWQVDDLPGDAQLPALSLQPLLENAVYHGIEPAPDGGLIVLRGEFEQDRLQIFINNTLSPGAGNSREGNQMAQVNVRQRLQAFFGRQSDLIVESHDDTYEVKITLPYQPLGR